MIGKNEILAYGQASLSRVATTLDEVDQSLDPDQKRIEGLEASS